MVAETLNEVRVCGFEDIPDGGGKAARAKNHAIAVFRVGDQIFALENACPHWGGPLSDGTVHVGRMEVICPWHRFRFDLRSGCNVLSDMQRAAKSYPVTVRDGDVFITIEE